MWVGEWRPRTFLGYRKNLRGGCPAFFLPFLGMEHSVLGGLALCQPSIGVGQDSREGDAAKPEVASPVPSVLEPVLVL